MKRVRINFAIEIALEWLVAMLIAMGFIILAMFLSGFLTS